MDNKKIAFKFLSYLKPYWLQELIILLAIVITSIGALSSPYILKIIIDTILPEKEYGQLMLILLLLLGINIVRIGSSLFSDYWYEWISNRIMLSIRRDLFNHITRLPMQFFRENSTGDIVFRINNEVNKIQSILTGSLLRMIQSVIMIIGIAIALSVLNLHLFLMVILILPIFYLNVRYFHPRIIRLIEEMRNKESALMNAFIDKIENIKLIKSFTRYEHEEAQIAGKINHLIESNLKHQLITSSSRSISTFLISLSPLLVLAAGGRLVILETMTLGALIAFIQYLNRIFNPFRELMRLYIDITRASVSMKRLFEYFEMGTEPSGTLIPEISRNTHGITLEKVDFYRGEKYVLRQLSYKFQYGKIYAIVGASGCGKSTLIDLICRFEYPSKGRIYINQTDLEDIDLHWLRSHIALVPQENRLFEETLDQNLRYGNLESSLTEVEQVAQTVGLYQEIQAQTEVGGTKLSGGQIQRLAIGRAILRNADILILDEATSALDSESEHQVIKNILHHHPAKLTLVVSHRLSTIRHVDEIICLDGGKVVEAGSYQDLLEKNGFFTSLFIAQIHDGQKRPFIQS